LARVTADGTEVTGVELRRMLERLATNLAFSWLPAVRDVFRDLDPDDWEESDHNPIILLAGLTDDRFERFAEDEDYVRRVLDAVAAATHELAGATWWAEEHPGEEFLAAYFSTEFALDESLPVYSGGLGVLAGDHLKSASELGVPLVGVGLFYQRGYFRQTLDETGWQQERYPVNDPTRLPLTLERRPSGEPVHVHLELAGEPIALQVWRVDVGRTRLYLLDANVDTNSEQARSVTDRLYGGDREHRIRQEVVLGVGGVRALRRLGLAPTVFHMNEGHSAFLAVERVRELTFGGLPLDRAMEEVRDSTVFTTHTPVPAGNEVFEPALVQRYLAGLVAGSGLDWDDFLALGRVGEDDLFGLTPLALRLSGRANGVSALHGAVAREMWQPLWPDRAVEDVPIGSVTNGVHARTWLSGELAARLDGDWSRVHELTNDELWALHVACKRELFEVARRRGASLVAGDDALTIGFARRFATYKRAGLLFSDPDRLSRLLADADRPVQIVLAGKAHPADDGGKELIREIWKLTRDDRFEGRVVFLEDYQMTLARQLVQGVDVWLNTPRRPQEASGTSGMKAAMNGVVNCSILDGWWAEASAPEVGFAIVGEAEAANDDEQDARDAASLFDVLEHEIVPAYYERDEQGLPARWLELMRASIEQLGGEYNTNRIVREYVETMYLPADESPRALTGATA
jgi:glycogen phosphorylase